MARIDEAEIERLKTEVDLAELVVRSGVALKKAGRDLVGCCPFHDDDTPSLVVTASKGLWHCLGACQTGGTAIDWVIKTQGVSFRHAVELLGSGEVPRLSNGKVVRTGTVRRLAAPVAADADDAEALAQVVAYYHRTLTGSREALAYLARRRIDHPEVVEHFSLGYANRTLGLRLPAKNRKAGAELRGRLTRLGLYRQSGHEHLAGSLVIPVIDPAGTVTDLYGRKIGAGLRPGTAVHLYLPGPHRGVWNEAGPAGGEVIVCESLIDALTLWCLGFTNTTASYGTAGFTAAHRQAFERHGVRRVLIAYDHDAAGDTAATTLATELSTSGIECLRVVLPLGSDVNDVAVAADDPARTLGALLREAQWLGTGRPAARRSVDLVVDREPAADVVDPPSSSAAQLSAVEVRAAEEDVPVPAVALSHDQLVVELGPRRWRVRHIARSPSPGSLRVNVMVGSGERFHVDTLDLYSAKHRAAYLDAAACELRVPRDQLAGELSGVLLATEDAQAAALAPAAPDPVVAMTTAEREQALELLSAPDLLDQVARAFVTLGVVGETTGALATWLTLTSRLSDRPLGAVVQSSSSAGKSTLADAALALMPAEATVAYSAMTGQALYYLGETDLSHKVLAVAEEEGASRAAYALKLLVSEGRLSIASAGKDPLSGRLVTHTYEVTGPVALLMTTTAAELDDELANRLLVLAVDEGRRQTRAVQVAQRQAETIEGLVARSHRAEVVALHANAQRLLAPVAVVNPHAPGLSFSDRATRARRDHAKYLGLIRAVALAHQHQRPRQQVEVGSRTLSYIEATAADVAAAQALCAEVLGATTDELSPVTRRLLEAIGAFVTEHATTTFTRRELRQATGLGDTQMKVHLSRLVDLEYVVANRAGPATTYELATSPSGADRSASESDRSGQDADRSGPQSDRSGQAPDRSAIGRFSRRSGRGSSPQVNGDEPGSHQESVGIGRVGPATGNPLPTSDDAPTTADRPGLVALRGTGPQGDSHVVVAR